MTESASRPGFINALHLRDYRLLWISTVFSSCAYWAMLIGRNWLVENLSDSAGWVGLVTFANMSPYFLATPFGGILADRFDRVRLTALMQVLSALSSVALAGLAFAGVVQPWHVVVLAFIAGCARAVETPAQSSIVPNLVRKEFLLNAIALTSVATFGSRLFGPASGAVVLRLTSTSGVFILSALLWLVAAAVMVVVHAPRAYLEERHESPVNIREETRQTLRYIGATPLIGLIFWLVCLHCTLTMSVDAIMPSYVKHSLRSGGSVYSFLIMAFGAGSLVGTFALAGLHSGEGKGKLVLVTGIGSGLATALLGIAPFAGVAFVAMAVMGATQSMFMALINTLLQEVVPDQLRGRVSSAYLMVSGGAMAIANLGFGFFSDQVGVRVILIVPSLLFVGLLLAISGVRPNLRHIYRTGTIDVAATAA
ncbi:MAG: MFS transporter [Dehalococcoidia bacterium]